MTGSENCNTYSYIKTSRYKNISKSWKQFKNNIILKWRSKTKGYGFSQKLLICIYSKECKSLSRKNWWFLMKSKPNNMNCKQFFLYLLILSFRACQKKGVFFQGLSCLLFDCISVYLMFITVNLVIFWSWSVRYSYYSWCLLAIITEFL